MTEQEKRAQFFAKTGRIATSELVEYQAFLWGMEYAEESLRQQLAEARSAITQKNRAIREAMEWNWLDGDEEIPSEVVEMLHQALDLGRTK